MKTKFYLRDWRMAFIKQVFPRFLKPTVFNFCGEEGYMFSWKAKKTNKKTSISILGSILWWEWLKFFFWWWKYLPSYYSHNCWKKKIFKCLGSQAVFWSILCFHRNLTFDEFFFFVGVPPFIGCSCCLFFLCL